MGNKKNSSIFFKIKNFSKLKISPSSDLLCRNKSRSDQNLTENNVNNDIRRTASGSQLEDLAHCIPEVKYKWLGWGQEPTYPLLTYAPPQLWTKVTSLCVPRFINPTTDLGNIFSESHRQKKKNTKNVVVKFI